MTIPLFSDEQLLGVYGEEVLRPIRERALVCQACPLAATRLNVVFGEGKSSRPAIAFVGEGPGAHEDASGHPFCGAAGNMLTKIVEAIGLSRDNVYVCNVVGCRPPQNRVPTEIEQAACREFLVGQLRAVRPYVIVTLGATALKALIGAKKELKDCRGKWQEWEHVSVLPTYHPAYLLRQPDKKREVWADMLAVKAKYEELYREAASKSL